MANYTNSVVRTLGDKLGEIPSVLDFNAKGNGVADDSTAFQNAVNGVAGAGGGPLFIPFGQYILKNTIIVPSDVYIFGGGPASQCFRGAPLGTGSGLFMASGTNIALDNFGIEGDVTTPTGITYASFGEDSYSPTLTANTSIWIQPGATNIRLRKLFIQHTGGYAVLVDSGTGPISNVSLDDCDFVNNRPFTFGTASGSTGYGAWPGGVLFYGDCNTSTFAINNVTVQNCRWSRNTGNCLWMDSKGFNIHHSNFTFVNNSFEDCGLDAIELGNLQGGIVANNRFHRGGYIVVTDTATSTPYMLPATAPVAIDCSGYVEGVTICDNEIYSQNGEFIDLDGFRNGQIHDNHCEIPDVGTPQYTSDQITSYGISGTNITAGFNFGDTQDNGGATSISIHDNYIKNCGYGALRLNFTKGCSIYNNHIEHPAAAAEVPIQLYCAGTTTNLQAYNNVISNNYINYNGDNFAIYEAGSGWAGTLTNTIFNNIVQGMCVGEFLRASASASLVGAFFSSNDSGLGTFGQSQSVVARTGQGSNGALQFRSITGGTNAVARYIAQLADVGPSINLSTLTSSGTATFLTGGLFLTAARTGAGSMNDLLFTGKVIGDGFVMLGGQTYADSDANQFDASYGMLRYFGGTTGGTGTFQLSTTTLSSTRVWAAIGGGGTTTPGGSNTDVQFNDSGTFGGVGSFTYSKATGTMSVGAVTFQNNLTTTNTATISALGIVLSSGFINSPIGYYSSNTTYNTVELPFGGAAAVSFSSIRNDGGDGFLLSRGSAGTASGQEWSLQVGTDSTFHIHNVTAGTNAVVIDTNGTATFGSIFAIAPNGYATMNGVLNAIGVSGGLEVTTNTAYNSIQVSGGGGMYANSFTALRYIQMGAGTLTSGTLTPTSGDSINNGCMYYDTGSNLPYVKINGTFTAFGTTGSGGGGSPGGGAGAVQFNSGPGTFAGSTNLNWSQSSLILTVLGTSISTHCIYAENGYVYSDGGFNANSGTATTYNAIQAPGGGMYAKSFTSLNYINAGNHAGTPTVTSGDSFNAGALFWNTSTGSMQVYNGSSWLNLLTSGGVVTTLQGSSGALTLSPGTGIGITGLTISNTGVTSLGGSTGALNLSAGTGVSVSGLTISIGQAVGTGANVEFNSIGIGTTPSGVPGVVSAIGEISGYSLNATTNGIFINSTTAINSSNQFVGAGVNCNAGIAGTGYNIYGGGSGQTWNIGFTVPFTINGSGSYTTLIFSGGILISAS